MIAAVRAGHEAMQTLISGAEAVAVARRQAQARRSPRQSRTPRWARPSPSSCAHASTAPSTTATRLDATPRINAVAQRAGRGAWAAVSRPREGDRLVLRQGAQALRAHADPGEGRATRWARDEGYPPDLVRDGAAATHAWLGDLHARPDAGAQHRDARLARRGADDRWPGRGGVEALHPPLQLPVVQRRRDALLAWPRTARDRAWRAGRARAGPGDPRARTSSPTRSASSPRCSARTARPRWARPAAARSR